MIDFDNRTDFTLETILFEKILETLSITKDVEFILCDNETIQQMNRDFRGVDKATDVLSFPFEEVDFAPLGTIVISIDFAHNAAKQYSHRVDEEITLLFIHGILHLIGMDHENDDGQMREHEAELINKFSLPSSLIVRTEGV